MTAQQKDTVVLDGVDHVLVRHVGKSLVCPSMFGMVSKMTSTMNRRGFSARYEVVKQRLFLSSFGLREASGIYVPINGVLPQVDDDWAYGCYSNLDLPMEFSGRMTLAQGWDWGLYARLCEQGRLSPEAYTGLKSIDFEGGVLVRVVDGAVPAEPRRNFLDSL